MGKMSREKGKRGEREFAELMRKYGFKAKRGQQHRGGSDSPDIIHDMEGFDIEVKYRETFSINDLWKAIDKLKEEGDGDQLVFYRRNGTRWLLAMDAEQFLTLMNAEVYH